MTYRTSRSTPVTPPAPFPASPGEWRILYPYFIPDGIEALIGAKFNAVDDYMHSSNGSWDGTRQSCFSQYADPVRGKGRSEVVADRIFSHYERGAAPGYTPTEVIRGWFDHYDTVTQELVFMLEKTSTAYQVNLRARA